MIGPHPFHAVGEKYIARGGAGGRLPAAADSGARDAARRYRNPRRAWTASSFPAVPRTSSRTRYAGPPSVPGTLHDPHRDATTLPLIPRAIARGRAGVRRLPRIPGNERRLRRHAAPEACTRSRDSTITAKTRKQPLDVQYGPAHEVTLEPGGLLRKLAGHDRITVNSLHWQGVRAPRAGSGGRGARARRADRSLSREVGAGFRARGAMAPGMEGDEQPVFAGAVRRVRQGGARRAQN